MKMKMKIIFLASVFVLTDVCFASHKQNNPKMAKAKTGKKSKKEDDDDLLLVQAQNLAEKAQEAIAAKAKTAPAQNPAKQINNMRDVNLFFQSVAKADEKTIDRLLLEKKVSINDKDMKGFTALMIACSRNNSNMVKFLLSKNADINMADKGNRVALMIACDNNHINLAKLLLANQALLDIQDENGRTPLVYACQGDHIEMMKLLLDAGAQPDMRDKNGETVLMIACNNDNIDIVKLLLDKGADPNIKSKDGISALSLAIFNGNIEMTKLLLEHKADPLLLFELDFEIDNLFIELYPELKARIMNVLFQNKTFKKIFNIVLDHERLEFEMLEDEVRNLALQDKNSEFEKLKKSEKKAFEKILQQEELKNEKRLEQQEAQEKYEQKKLFTDEIKQRKLIELEQQEQLELTESQEQKAQLEVKKLKKAQNFISSVVGPYCTYDQVETLLELLKEQSFAIPLEINLKQTLFGKYTASINADHIINTKITTIKLPNQDKYEVVFAGGHFDASIQNVIRCGFVTLVSQVNLPGGAILYTLLNNISGKIFTKTAFPKELTIQEVINLILKSRLINEFETEDLIGRETIIVNAKKDEIYIKNILKKSLKNNLILVSSYPIHQDESVQNN